jgi:HKD family nuclease
VPHDIIDNRNDRLVDQIRTILGSTDAARFAVGYFFLSGFTALADKLEHVSNLKLLIGNTTSRETLEQIAEGYKRLELVREAVEAQVYPKRTDVKRMATETATNIRLAVEVMDQTDEAEQIVKTLARMIEEKRLFVRVYTKGRLHAKAYIFDYGPSYDLFGHKQSKLEQGVAVVGSSNLTLSGISHNTELNVVVHGNSNHEELVRWFDALWEESENFDETLMQEIQQSWAMAPVRPYDVYMKALYSLVRDRIEGEDQTSGVTQNRP